MSGIHNLLKTFFDVDDMMAVFPTLITVGLRNTLLLAVLALVLAVISGLLLSLLTGAGLIVAGRRRFSAKSAS